MFEQNQYVLLTYKSVFGSKRFQQFKKKSFTWNVIILDFI